MDKNNEQKNNKTPEMKPKQDSFRPWLKLIPAAAVFAAVFILGSMYVYKTGR